MPDEKRVQTLTSDQLVKLREELTEVDEANERLHKAGVFEYPEGEPKPIPHRRDGSHRGRWPKYCLIPPIGLRRLALVYEEGSRKYGARSLQKGLDAENVIDHMVEHLLKWEEGDRSEDHLAKIAWAAMTLMWNEEYFPDCNKGVDFTRQT